MATVIGIDLGEEAFGMSAGEGRLMLTIRGEYDDELEMVKHKLEEKTKEQAKRYGLEYSMSFCDTFSATVSHKESTDKVRRAAKELGLTLLEEDRPSRGSEDFGCFTRRTGGAFFFVGCGENHPAIHTAEYDFDDGIIPTVADLYTALVRA
jgi:metal-dependent amidase/aminoacylase/carboxypeptidase family protein